MIEFKGNPAKALVRSKKLKGNDFQRAVIDFRISSLRRHLTKLVADMKELVNVAGPSAPGMPPGRQSGDLYNSIGMTEESQKSGHVFKIIVGVPYALYLEKGTSRMAKRPYIQPSQDNFLRTDVPQIEQEVREFTAAYLKKG